MTRTMEIPERIYRRVERRGGECGYTVPKLTVLLYTSWLDGKISLGEKQAKDQLDDAYSRGFDFLKDEIGLERGISNGTSAAISRCGVTAIGTAL